MVSVTRGLLMHGTDLRAGKDEKHFRKKSVMQLFFFAAQK